MQRPSPNRGPSSNMSNVPNTMQPNPPQLSPLSLPEEQQPSVDDVMPQRFTRSKTKNNNNNVTERDNGTERNKEYLNLNPEDYGK